MMLELYKNGEGYFDPTMGDALAYEEKRKRKARYLISVILFIAREAGFHIDTRIELTDHATGRKIL